MDDAKQAHQGKSDRRDQFIPIRKTDILKALIETGPLDAVGRDRFHHLCRLLASIFHFEYFERLERLRDSYFYFNPELASKAKFDASAIERAYSDLVESFAEVLKAANFVQVSQEEIERAHRESAVMRVTIETPIDEFREVRFYRRGHHVETVEVDKWFGLRQESTDVEVYDDVILFVAMKSHEEYFSKLDRKRLKQLKQRNTRPGCVLIKFFRNIASEDLNALFPNARVVMSTKDKLILGIPALAGGIPIIFKVATTATVLFAVIGAYLGISGAVRDDDMATALAALSGFVALGAFMTRQWVKYQRQSLRYQKQLSDNVYYRNVNNNAGIFDYMIGAAEDQECKEAFLAYYFLLTTSHPLSQAELDERIEHWLQETFAVDVDFEVEDGLHKLRRLGLIAADDGRLSVLPLDSALAKLDHIWDNYFQYNASQMQKAAAEM
jgi:hypothetical protein